jgi:hypothetical protein
LLCFVIPSVVEGAPPSRLGWVDSFVGAAVDFAGGFVEFWAVGVRRWGVRGCAVVGVALLEFAQALAACLGGRDWIFIVRHSTTMPTDERLTQIYFR